jgi:hypothetical protein
MIYALLTLAITVFVLLYVLLVLVRSVKDIALLVKAPTLEHYLYAQSPTPTQETAIDNGYVPIEEMTEDEINGLASKL